MSKIRVNRKNQHAARERFGIVGQDDLVLHHIDENLMYTDPERYNEWRDEDLVVMPRSKHTKHHAPLLDRSNWNFAKGEANGANTHPEKNCFSNGNNPSSLHPEKTTFVVNNPAKKLAGTHYYNNGEVEVRTLECPEGFVQGRLPANGEKISKSKKGKPSKKKGVKWLPEAKAKHSQIMKDYYQRVHQ